MIFSNFLDRCEELRKEKKERVEKESILSSVREIVYIYISIVENNKRE